PRSVLWVSGVSAFLAFLLGSVPAHGGTSAAWEFDLNGAVLWAMAGAGFFGGGTLFLVTGQVLPGLAAAGLGAAIACCRILAERPPRVPRNYPLSDGINRFPGETQRARLRAAKRAFKKASFSERPGSSYFATRAPREWWYVGGMAYSDCITLNMALAAATPTTFDILVVLVRNLPDEPDQPAVIVVQGAANLRKVRVHPDRIEIPGQTAIATSAVVALVAYAWR
ncbi:MAG: hypothetical protein JSS86_13795, partial [Cyanobacteria bacterium SZAS LIN-2]|nr:hypothetical protein [Cyanobacteria bacterium SZAS LIN-2]